MKERFDSFVVLADMRTGSNFLEANLNAIDGLHCHGELFNPHFVGYPNKDAALGVTAKQREADPARLLTALRDAPGLNGFRLFSDHDPRLLPLVMADGRCAKIILTRNPLDSFISLQLARQTGQWKLTNVTRAKSGKVHFDPAEFRDHLTTLSCSQRAIEKQLQHSGQAAFRVAYEELQDLDVINGMAAFLGTDARSPSLDKKMKKQNPASVKDKVENYDVLERNLAALDPFALDQTVSFEPTRGPALPGYVAAAKSPILFLPIRSNSNAVVKRWMADLDDVRPDDLLVEFNQRSLREWKQGWTSHRSFTVLRHPLARAHSAFCHHIIGTGAGAYTEIRANLRKNMGLSVPADGGVPQEGADYDLVAHRSAFLQFLDFLKLNLAGQTSIRVDGSWASQSEILLGFSQYGSPDLILREESLGTDLAILAGQIGKATMPALVSKKGPADTWLYRIYDSDLEAAAKRAYSRDYWGFGFAPWSGGL